MDQNLLLLIVLLVLSLGAFLIGFIPYPVGLLFLSVLIMLRFDRMRKEKEKKEKQKLR